MKILIVSDTHGNIYPLKKVLEVEKDFDMFIHCGDVGVDVTEIYSLIDCPCHIIAGNNDFFSGLPREDIFSIGNNKVLVTHGHNYGVYLSYDRLYYLAVENGFNIVMFGHTHAPHIECSNGVWLINPGSISLPRTADRKMTYIIMDIDDLGAVNFELKNI
ncbi:MAG: metallophosphoesterase [Lachnospiraceae bacterium]|nr:metallophosphoesterase [Lachnospiraceae bacterium]